MGTRFRPPREIPDIGPNPPAQQRFKAWMRAVLVEISEDMAALGRDSSDTLIAQETIDVDVPSLRRVTPPVGGMGVRLPPPSAENAGKSVRLMIESPVGALTVVSRPGIGDDGKVSQPTVNGEPRATFSVSGLVVLTSNGVNDWKTDAEFPAESPAVAEAREEQAGIDATYHLAVAHPDLPNARVADDSTEISVDNTSPGLVSWFLNTASVAFSKLSNLAGLSVLGRAASTTGVMAAITATSAKQVLRNAGANLHWEYPVSVGSPFVWIFDGVDDRADYGDVLDMDRTTARSIFFWYATTSTAGPCVIGKQATSTSAGWRFCVSNSTLDWILRGATQQLQVGLTTPAPLDGSMHLLGMTYTGSSNATGVEFYLDTVNVAKTIGTNNLTSESTQNATSLLVGRRGTDAHFTGGIQHVSVWNRVLTAGEVDQLSDGGAPADLASLSFFSDCILWSKFDGTDTAGASGIADHSASNFDGTAQGGLAPSGGDEQVHTFVEGGGVDLSVLENVCTVTREALTGDITAAAGSNVTDISPGVIVNADVNASAAIAQTKLGATTGFSVKASGSAATTSAEPIVTYSASANMSAERVTTSSTSVTVDIATANQIEFRRAALTGAIAAPSNSNATLFAGIRDNGSAENDRTNLNFVSSTSCTAVVTDDAANDELEITFQRAALTGDVTASADSNTTAIAAGVIVDADVNASAAIAMTKTGALTGDVTKASGSDVTAIAAGVIVNADVNASAAIALSKLESIGADSIVATGTSGTVPTDMSITANTAPANTTEGGVSNGLAAVARDDLLRWICSTVNTSRFFEEFQGKLDHFTGAQSRWTVTGFAGIATGTIINGETHGSLDLQVNSPDGTTRSTFVLGADETAQNFHFGGFRYFGAVFRTGTGSSAANTQFSLGIAATFAGYGAIGAGILGSTSTGSYIEYDNSLSANWRVGNRVASTNNVTDTGVAFATNTRWVFEIFRTSGGTSYYYLNNTLYRTDTDGPTTGAGTFFLSLIGSTTAARLVTLDTVCVISQNTNRFT